MTQAASSTRKATPVPVDGSDGAPLPRIFIVDDEPGILQFIATALDSAGFETSGFTRGREFSDAVLSDPPDGCVIDLAVPDIDGVGILNSLAAHNYRGRILLISGRDSQVLRAVTRLAEEKKLNVVGCLQKPFLSAPLIGALKGSASEPFAATCESVRAAIDANEMETRFQPIVDMKDRRIIAAEALVRWRHPREGVLAPARFIGTLDHEGMNRLTLLVMRDVFRHRAAFNHNGTPVRLAVNVPVSTVLDGQFIARLLKLADDHDASLEGITLELTETDMIVDHHQVATALASLCLRGMNVAIDDFGTGYSSLAHLQRLPISEVKIDRSFICQCDTHNDDRKIVAAVIALAHALDMKVVAEGVETETICSLIGNLGCDKAQGYLFGRPVSAQEFADLVRH